MSTPNNIIRFPLSSRVAEMRYGKDAGKYVRKLEREGHSPAMALNDARRKFHGASKGRPFSPSAA